MVQASYSDINLTCKLIRTFVIVLSWNSAIKCAFEIAQRFIWLTEGYKDPRLEPEGPGVMGAEVCA